MDEKKIDWFVMANHNNFKPHQQNIIRDTLTDIDESGFRMAQGTEYKDPTTMLIISLLAGGFGVDRFMLGQTGVGLLKLFTLGGFGFWALIDLFLIMNATKDSNFEKFKRATYRRR